MSIIGNRIITPEIIFQKLYDRLKEKVDELEYLMCTENRFEKWLQCELALSMSDMLLPVIYDKNYKEIIFDKYEKVRDIALEYTLEGSENDLRSDLFISERPFALKYADEENWQVLHTDYTEKCKEDFDKTRFHYIEVKQRSWINVKNRKDLIDIMVEDMKKYSKQDWRSFKSKSYLSSVISICVTSFWDKSFSNDQEQEINIQQAIEDIQQKSLKTCKSNYKDDCQFLWQGISDEIYLLMLFYKIKEEVG